MPLWAVYSFVEMPKSDRWLRTAAVTPADSQIYGDWVMDRRGAGEIGQNQFASGHPNADRIGLHFDAYVELAACERTWCT